MILKVDKETESVSEIRDFCAQDQTLGLTYAKYSTTEIHPPVPRDMWLIIFCEYIKNIVNYLLFNKNKFKTQIPIY